MTATIHRLLTISPAPAAVPRGVAAAGGGDASIPLHLGAKPEENASEPLDMNRKIAAILAADVEGYSRLVAADEEGALRRLVEAQAVFREHISAYRGRIFNTAGDAILAEFPSAVDATRAALEIQRDMVGRNTDRAPDDRFQFRIGLNIGDVVEHEGDLLGDGVNIAARIQTLAPAGGLAISHWVRELTAGKIPVPFRDIGKKSLKNIPSPVHVFVADIAFTSVPIGEAATVEANSKAFFFRVAFAAVLLLAIGAVAASRFRAPRPAAPTAPFADTAKSIAPTPPATVEDTKAVTTAVVPVAPIAQPPIDKEPSFGSARPQESRPPSETTIVVPQPVTKIEKEVAAPAPDRKRSPQNCAEVLERAQLGDISASDRAFLRNQCR